LRRQSGEHVCVEAARLVGLATGDLSIVGAEDVKRLYRSSRRTVSNSGSQDEVLTAGETWNVAMLEKGWRRERPDRAESSE
jgi:hypothetical protein